MEHDCSQLTQAFLVMHKPHRNPVQGMLVKPEGTEDCKLEKQLK